MVRVDLRGIAKIRAKGKTYWYAWRGGPRLHGEPGTPEFMASYNEAVESRKAPDPARFRALVVSYKASPAYTGLADTTHKNWGPWLDRISEQFGELRIAQFERPEKIRPVILRWRKQWADKPRTADFALQVLSRVLSHAVEDGRLAGNPCEGIKRSYAGDRSEIIWTDADIAQLQKAGGSRKIRGKQMELPCPAELMHAVDLAAHTGLRAGDLLRLCWSHVQEDAIVMATSKSNHRCEAIIPLYDGLREVLARIPKRSTVILTNKRGHPWKGFATRFTAAKKAAGLRNLHFHDLRGTAATRFYIAGLSIRVIAEILAWSEDNVEKIIRRYVARGAATMAAIQQLNEARRGTEAAKPAAKL
ncbi:MAG TPA: site-specific integrase [Xanthobacteraceae bacterium]|jgi:integrase